jgi:AraC-type DNA-binding domain-containing proteins
MGSSTVYTPKMKIWTADELKINGLNLFGYCRFSKATDPLKRHIHENCFEFICLLKGEDTYYIEGQRYHMRGDDIFISFPGQEHFSGDSHQGIGEYVWFQIDPYAKGNFLGLSDENSYMLKEMLLCWKVHLVTVSPKVIQYAKKLYCALNEKQDILYCTGQLICFLSLILCSQNTVGSIDKHIQTAMDYIMNHLDSKLTMKEIGDVCGMSESGFKHKFRQETGYTPCDYINRNRIMRASEMLIKGCSVVQAAMDTGFNSSDYFAVVFKKYTLQTPSEYVNMMAGRNFQTRKT